jgi:hypothetical protein
MNKIKKALSEVQKHEEITATFTSDLHNARVAAGDALGKVRELENSLNQAQTAHASLVRRIALGECCLQGERDQAAATYNAKKTELADAKKRAEALAGIPEQIERNQRLRPGGNDHAAAERHLHKTIHDHERQDYGAEVKQKLLRLYILRNASCPLPVQFDRFMAEFLEQEGDPAYWYQNFDTAGTLAEIIKEYSEVKHGK